MRMLGILLDRDFNFGLVCLARVVQYSLPWQNQAMFEMDPQKAIWSLIFNAFSKGSA